MSEPQVTWGFTNLGRCPLCVAAGARHALHIDEQTRPSNNYLVTEWWDEDGRQHLHDREKRLIHMRCSNGHAFVITHLSRCPCRGCEWNNAPEVNGGTGWPEPPKEGSDAVASGS